jgi:phosphatidylglycerol---prolipoprotein diacylglyceryl transferase
MNSLAYLHYSDLHLSPVFFHVFGFPIRWYALAYIGGILLAWGYMRLMRRRAPAPLLPAQLEDLIFYATLGVIIGGRLGQMIFYEPDKLFSLELFRVWDGGMAFHGGLLGVMLAIIYVARKYRLAVLPIFDWVVCAAPIGLFLGRLANFVNGELWGRVSFVRWAMVFDSHQIWDAATQQYLTESLGAGLLPRHPSQLYEAAWEGVLLFLVLGVLFWRTRAAQRPGLLAGVFLIGYGLGRYLIEFVRETDANAIGLSWGFSMGQALCVPMLLGGAWLVWRALKAPMGASGVG